MLNKINKLKPFFEDNYQEFGVREYSRLMELTPPTASKILKEFESQGLLKKREERRYLLFRTNRENEIMNDLSRIYWRQKLQPLINYIEDKIIPSKIILFGSLIKLEAKQDSDIDLCIITSSKNEIDLKKFEKEYKREIQVFKFASIEKINKELRSNIINGMELKGDK